MHNYKITFEIKPSAWFGLPDDKNVIIPGGSQFLVYISPNSSYTKPVTLSEFRKVEDIINVKFEQDKVAIEIKDNDIIFTFKEVNAIKAIQFAKLILNKFLKTLQLNYSKSFFFYIEREFLEDYRVMSFPKESGRMGFSLIAYNLDKITEGIKNSISQLPKQDIKIERFLDYFDKAIFLESLLIEDKFSTVRYSQFLKTERFLNYFKAITTLVGDPSIDKDYQSRYKELGFDINFFNNELEPLRDLRNNFDIAHYSMRDNEELNKKIDETFNNIKDLAIKIYLKYIEYLDKTL